MFSGTFILSLVRECLLESDRGLKLSVCLFEKALLLEEEEEEEEE